MLCFCNSLGNGVSAGTDLSSDESSMGPESVHLVGPESVDLSAELHTTALVGNFLFLSLTWIFYLMSLVNLQSNDFNISKKVLIFSHFLNFIEVKLIYNVLTFYV